MQTLRTTFLLIEFPESIDRSDGRSHSQLPNQSQPSAIRVHNRLALDRSNTVGKTTQHCSLSRCSLSKTSPSCRHHQTVSVRFSFVLFSLPRLCALPPCIRLLVLAICDFFVCAYVALVHFNGRTSSAQHVEHFYRQ